MTRPPTLLCVDVSYLLFYRITALRTWHKHRTKEDATEDVMWSDAFKSKLLDRIQATLRDLCNTHQPHAVLCAYDGHRNWRKQQYKEYKKGRKHDSSVLKLFQYGQTYIANHPWGYRVPCTTCTTTHWKPTTSFTTPPEHTSQTTPKPTSSSLPTTTTTCLCWTVPTCAC